MGQRLLLALNGYLIANQVFAGIARGQQLAPKLF
jgi:hypothetical protein